MDYASEALKEALGRTLGVPIFQEQVIQIAVVAAGFTPGEADRLRRSMAAWKRKGGLQHYYNKIVHGTTARGYEHASQNRSSSRSRASANTLSGEPRGPVRAAGLCLVLGQAPPPGRVYGRDAE